MLTLLTCFLRVPALRFSATFLAVFCRMKRERGAAEAHLLVGQVGRDRFPSLVLHPTFAGAFSALGAILSSSLVTMRDLECRREFVKSLAPGTFNIRGRPVARV